MKTAKNVKWLIVVFGVVAMFNLNNCSGGDSAPVTDTEKKEVKPAKKEVEVVAAESNSETTESASPASSSETADFMSNKGIGPIKKVELGELNAEMAAAGKKVYEEKCTSCHKAEKRFIGPAPKGILERRSPEWVMNMILNPEQMVKEDPIAKALLIEYNLSPMANQNLTEEEARKVLEYFRTL